MKKKILVGGCLLLLCFMIILGGILFFFGYFEIDGTCFYKGPSANPTSGVCSQNSNESTQQDLNNSTDTNTNEVNYTGDYSIDFTFKYDNSKLNLKDSVTSNNYSSVLLSLKEKNTNNGNDNASIIITNSSFDLSYTNCLSLGQNATSTLTDEGYIVDKTSLNYSLGTYGSNDACHVLWNASKGNINIEQDQYYFPDTKRDQTYILTITNSTDSVNKEVLFNIANTFEIK